MSSSKEFFGKNVESAIRVACEELNVLPENLEHEVLTYGSTGIFGLVGTKKARIRVFLPDGEGKEIDLARTKEPEDIPDLEKEINEYDEITSRPAIKPAIKPTIKIDELADYGKEVLEEIITVITADASISIDIKKDKIFYHISSENSALLIGKRGQTLDAIQYIVEKIINKKNGDRIRLQIDVEGYLENRKVNLQELASKLASKVKRTGKPVTVGHMSAHDRRIIHVALKNDKKVRTQSMGDGFLRKLMIFPKRKRQNPRKNKKHINGNE